MDALQRLSRSVRDRTNSCLGPFFTRPPVGQRDPARKDSIENPQRCVRRTAGNCSAIAAVYSMPTDFAYNLSENMAAVL